MGTQRRKKRREREEENICTGWKKTCDLGLNSEELVIWRSREGHLRQREQHLQNPRGPEDVVQSEDGMTGRKERGVQSGGRQGWAGWLWPEWERLEAWAKRWSPGPVSQWNPVVFVNQESQQSAPVLDFLL